MFADAEGKKVKKMLRCVMHGDSGVENLQPFFFVKGDSLKTVKACSPKVVYKWSNTWLESSLTKRL